jgi:hypothetical protein
VLYHCVSVLFHCLIIAVSVQPWRTQSRDRTVKANPRHTILMYPLLTLRSPFYSKGFSAVDESIVEDRR